jgi:hypothetical protein
VYGLTNSIQVVGHAWGIRTGCACCLRRTCCGVLGYGQGCAWRRVMQPRLLYGARGNDRREGGTCPCERVSEEMLEGSLAHGRRKVGPPATTTNAPVPVAARMGSASRIWSDGKGNGSQHRQAGRGSDKERDRHVVGPFRLEAPPDHVRIGCF